MASQFANDKDDIFAEEAFVVDVQIFLHNIMLEKGMSRADLARAMKVSRPRITQIFSDDCKNFTVRLLARAMHALGESPELISRRSVDLACETLEYKSLQAPSESDCTPTSWSEAEEVDLSQDWLPANDNLFASLSHIRRSQPTFRMAA